MTEDPSDSLDAQLPDETVRELVATLRPAWDVTGIERSDHGTDFVAFLAVETPDGPLESVLKATTADLVDPPVARSEPRFLALVGRETTVPVPEVYGYCDDHDDHPTPFYLMERVGGENFENRGDELSRAARERVLREAGENLAALHDLGTLPAVGTVGVRDGDLAVLDTEDHPAHDDFRDWLLDGCEFTLDALEDGGFFPSMADDRERFADLVPALREYCREAVPALPEPDPPRYCHRDYRLGNLLVDPETGETRAVLDWANALAAPPAYNLATTESLVLDPDDPDEPTADLRRTFRDAYAAARDGWTVDEATRERMRCYRFTSRLGAMACLPLWLQDATPEERDEREQEHREFVRQYL